MSLVSYESIIKQCKQRDLLFEQMFAQKTNQHNLVVFIFSVKQSRNEIFTSLLNICMNVLKIHTTVHRIDHIHKNINNDKRKQLRCFTLTMDFRLQIEVIFSMVDVNKRGQVDMSSLHIHR